MHFATTLAAACIAAVSAERVAVHHKPLTMEGIQSQKNYYMQMANANSEEVPVKDYMNTQYFVNVDVGTPAQTFTLVPDTGSSNLWLYAHDCKSIPCRTHDTYDATASSTYVADGQDFEIEYGSGGVSGYVSKDVATLGGANADMSFGEVKKVSGATFYVSQMDGIIGLAYDSISVDGLPTWLESSDLSDKSFGFYLKDKSEESYMTIPGFETEGYTKIMTHDVIEKTYWNVNLTNMKGPNGSTDTTGFKAAIDSGTSLIIGPQDLMDSLVEGITVAEDCAGVESLPDITFTFDETDYLLTYEDYVVRISNPAGDQCIMGIMGMPTPAGFNYVIVGDVFMRPYATHFNRDDNTVTFYSKDE